MSLQVDQLLKGMLGAFKGELNDKWPSIKEYAETEAKKLAENFVLIEKLKLMGEIDQEQAALQHQIQLNASKAVLLAVEGMSLVMAEQAINAAFASVKDTVNGALGFVLL